MQPELIAQEWWWSSHVAVTWALVGLIWVVQCIVYPMMAEWPRDRFKVIHDSYIHRMGQLVGPLMLLELTGAIAWVWHAPSSSWAWAAGGLMAIVWVSTGAIQVPLHRKLGGGFSAEIIAKLVITNWIRTWAWTARGVVVLLPIIN